MKQLDMCCRPQSRMSSACQSLHSQPTAPCDQGMKLDVFNYSMSHAEDSTTTVTIRLL